MTILVPCKHASMNMPYSLSKPLFELHREKTNNVDFWPSHTQTRLYSHWKWLEAWNFVLRKKRYCTIQVAKTKALISFAVTAKLICVFVFAYADSWFSHDAAHLCKEQSWLQAPNLWNVCHAQLKLAWNLSFSLYYTKMPQLLAFY